MTEATTEAGRRALLERLFAAFNRHDADGVMACFTPGVVFDTAAGPDRHGRRLTGQEAVRAAFVGVWTDMPDVAWTVADHTIAGDRATSEWLFTGTRPDGGRVEVDGVDLFTFEGGLIARKSAFRKDRPVQTA
ncbi:nuclear transport factor 2 family protein [Methylobacterium sp. CM6257]|jgi:ketosteroid isomerase-like protein